MNNSILFTCGICGTGMVSYDGEDIVEKHRKHCPSCGATCEPDVKLDWYDNHGNLPGSASATERVKGQ